MPLMRWLIDRTKTGLERIAQLRDLNFLHTLSSNFHDK